jgi:chemotaxis protein MotB
MARHKRGHDDHEVEHDESERWLVSFADMMTLLFALFMVLFSISSVNTSKFTALQKALQDAFSGRVLSGGKSIQQTGSDTEPKRAAAEPPLASLQPLNAIAKLDERSQDAAQEQKAADAEQQDFQKLKRRIDNLAKQAGLKGKVVTTVTSRGLVIQLLTDRVFFDSGQAVIKPQAKALVTKIGTVVRDERTHPIEVQGHTDSQPIHNSTFSSNFDLSGARASAVIDDFVSDGVLARRITLVGNAANEPVDTNTTAAGRAKNRRVEIVLTRLHPTTS